VAATETQLDLVEVSPRDGLQNESVHLTTEQKLELIERAIAAGATRIEATGFARPDVVPALADADALSARLAFDDGIEQSALIVNGRGYDRALAAGFSSVNFVVLASETFSERNQRRSTDYMLGVAKDLAARCQDDGSDFAVTVGAAFGCPFEGEIPLSRLRYVLESLAEVPITEISLADTIGVATPRDVADRFTLLSEVLGAIPRAHFHDTRNTGLANAVAAFNVGVRVMDTSLAGIGGCPFAPAATGNLATEDVVYCFERMGVATGFDLDALIEHATWLSGLLGPDRGSSLMRAGAFPAGSAVEGAAT
jgi:hydroxymethylglutaryl-CoA lyase